MDLAKQFPLMFLFQSRITCQYAGLNWILDLWNWVEHTEDSRPKWKYARLGLGSTWCYFFAPLECLGTWMNFTQRQSTNSLWTGDLVLWQGNRRKLSSRVRRVRATMFGDWVKSESIKIEGFEHVIWWQQSFQSVRLPKVLENNRQSLLIYGQNEFSLRLADETTKNYF